MADATYTGSRLFLKRTAMVGCVAEVGLNSIYTSFPRLYS